MILDAHLHVWDTSVVSIAWLAGAGLPPTASIPKVSGDRRYILVEADADDPEKEADWLAAVAAKDPQVHGVVASVALEKHDAGEKLASVAALPKVVGVRRLLQDRDLFGSSSLVQGMKLLAAHGLPFDACVRAGELSALTQLVGQVPELTVVLDHMGKPEIGNEQAMHKWRRDLACLAELPNVHCKLSGLPAECRDAKELESVVTDVVGAAVEVFGPGRCLLGSDHPVSEDPSDWCSRVLELLPAADRSAVAHENALRIYSRRPCQ
ncbi:amidohydrolase family protein [Vreelandella gomseomensis]|uniref:Amidohydrolase family protein n=1 Tax=Vreelandella gomseomensis TaxID=370766 RepID=A0ABU1G9K1_9GAMM|nr:amidohydrolase family protein [Halomonas gomseomensis]MDR5874172.1 amidohydrolase family protein [Halomonas gomseomensis]